jgi:hypothetical protein
MTAASFVKLLLARSSWQFSICVRNIVNIVAEMTRTMRTLIVLTIGLIVTVLSAPCAHAQHSSPPAGMSEKEKAKLQEKRAFEKDTDEAYKSTISKIPDAKQKLDPWGNMRTAPQK